MAPVAPVAPEAPVAPAAPVALQAPVLPEPLPSHQNASELVHVKIEYIMVSSEGTSDYQCITPCSQQNSSCVFLCYAPLSSRFPHLGAGRCQDGSGVDLRCRTYQHFAIQSCPIKCPARI